MSKPVTSSRLALQNSAIVLVFAAQILCAFFFVVNILSSITGYWQFSWMVHELIELGAALGLLLGVALGAVTLRRALRRTARVEDQLRVASGAFQDVIDERFVQWGLSPAERDVALFAIKGMSTIEIADLRDVSEGTIKAQTNSIYRKAGVTGRPQLLSQFIEDLMSDIT